MDTTEIQVDPALRRMSLLFVCAANICRSPACKAIMQQLLRRRGLQDQFTVDSAGILDDRVGERAQWKIRWAGLLRGYRVRGIARRVSRQDLMRFDLVVAMDRNIVSELKKISDQPRARICLLTDFLPQSDGPDILDPIYAPWGAVWRLLRQFERACPRILEAIQSDAPPMAIAGARATT